MWLRCEKCGTDTPEQWVSNNICQTCGHDVLYEVDYCSLCDTCYDNENEDDNVVYEGLCTNCLISLLEGDFDLCYCYLNKDKQIEIDFFITYRFKTQADLRESNTDYDLIELCRQNFNITANIGQNWRCDCHKEMVDFISCDIDKFAEWYVEYSASKVNGQYCGDKDREPRSLVEGED